VRRIPSPGALVVAAFALTLPLGLTAVGPLQVVQLTAVLTVAGVGLALAAAAPAPTPPVRGIAWASALVLAAVVSVPSTVDADLTFRAFVQLTTGVLLALAVAAATRAPRDSAAVQVALALMATVVAAGALRGGGDLSAAYGGAVAAGRAQGMFAQPNELGVFCAVTLPLLVALAVGARSRAARLMGVLGALTVAGALVLSLSRGAWIGTAVSLLCLVALLGQLRRRLLVPLLGVVAAGTVVAVVRSSTGVPGIVLERLQTVLDPAANPYDERPLIYREAWRQLEERPLVGDGLGAFPSVAGPATPTHGILPAEHAHNLLLTAATEAGVPAAVLLVAFAGWLAAGTLRGHRALIRQGRDRLLPLLAGPAAGLAALLAHGVVDYPLRNPVLFLLTWTVVGLLLGALAWTRDERVPDAAEPAVAVTP
jgi:O-antigen ligase